MRKVCIDFHINDSVEQVAEGVVFTNGLVVLEEGGVVTTHPSIEAAIQNYAPGTSARYPEDRAPDTPDSVQPTEGVLAAVADERARQDARWGPQDHSDGISVKYMRKAEELKALAEEQNLQDNLTWNTILQEEVYEALSCDAPDTLRSELIQVAAVAVAWVEALDSRKAEEDELMGTAPVPTASPSVDQGE